MSYRFAALATMFAASGAWALDLIDVDRHRKSGALQLGVTRLDAVQTAWKAHPKPTGPVAELCVKGANRGFAYAGFDGHDGAAKLRWLRLSAGTIDSPHCATHANIPNLAEGLASGLKVGMKLDELLLSAGKLFRVVDDEWIFENVGERSLGRQKVLYQLLVQARVRDNRVYELTVSYGETQPK